MKVTLIFSIIIVLLVAAAGCTPGASGATSPAASAPSASPTPPNFKLTRFIWDIDSLYLSGTADVPDGTRLSTGLYKDGQAVDWLPPLEMAYVQAHKWDVRVHGLQSNIPAFLPDFAPGYSFRIYEGYNAEKGAAFALPFPAPEITPASGLADSQWKVVSLNGKPLVAGTYISLYFDKNKKGIAGGSGTINSYGGQYGAEAPDKVFFYEISLTSMGGPPDWEQQEHDYLRCLHKADFFKITDDRLEIYDSSHAPLLILERVPELAMDPASLGGTQWVLGSLNGAPVPDGLSITLNFDSDIAASGRAGIFWYWLSYQASGDDIRWGIQSARGNGEMPPELEKQALDYTSMISWAANYRLTSNKLEILTSKGETLTYQPAPDTLPPSPTPTNGVNISEYNYVFDNLQEKLTFQEMDTFAGMINNGPTMTVLFTRDGPQTIRKYVPDQYMRYIQLGTAEVSLAELRKTQEEAIASFRGLGIDESSDVDISANRVMVWVSEVDRPRVDEAVRSGQMSFPDYVDIITLPKSDPSALSARHFPSV